LGNFSAPTDPLAAIKGVLLLTSLLLRGGRGFEGEREGRKGVGRKKRGEREGRRLAPRA